LQFKTYTKKGELARALTTPVTTPKPGSERFNALDLSLLPMNVNLSTNLGRLRLTALFEGLSLIFLVFIAMPVKYMMGQPALVQIIGLVHGILFLLYVLLTFRTASDLKWDFVRKTLPVLAASVVPFGTFYIDNKILKPAAAGK